MNNKKDAAIGKRQEIFRANRVMFVFVAGASALAGVAFVLMGYLIQDVNFSAKVISEQEKSINEIQSSTANVKKLEEKVKALQTNRALQESTAIEGENPLRVIIDALPVVGNDSALGSSLSQKILTVQGVKLESLSVDPIKDTTTNSSTSSSSSSSSATSTTSKANSSKLTPISPKVKTINFSMTLSAEDQNSSGRGEKLVAAGERLQEVLRRMERSIRTMNVRSFKFDKNKKGATLNIQGTAYYMPEDTLQLKPKTIVLDEDAAKKNAKKTTKTGGTK